MRMQQDPVAWLYSLQGLGIKLGLDNIRTLLDRIGHPELSYHKVLVGGTNGKGSVCAMLEAMLGRHGLRTGMFTSPHLVRPNERVRIDGEDLPDADLHRILSWIREAIESGMSAGRLDVHPSFFETITATALQAFHEARVDVGILEVGMGGRLDATNAGDADLSVVVTVGLDHTKSLGATLEKIAFEKGGIIKPDRPVVSGVLRENPRSVLMGIARDRGARWVDAHARCSLEEDPCGESFTLVTPGERYGGLMLSLAGRHQRENARVALVALEELASVAGFRPDPEAVAAGLAEVRWAGRLQRIPGHPEILLDAAHNPDGTVILADYLKTWSGPPPVLLFGATREKDLDEVLLPLAPYVRGLVASRPAVNRAMEPERIVEYARPHFDPVVLRPEAAEALETARDLAGPEGTVLIAGSLYLVGNVMAAMEREPVPGPVAM
jgi:dihydrofolate synthase/folylpolyglutamate synthase